MSGVIPISSVTHQSGYGYSAFGSIPPSGAAPALLSGQVVSGMLFSGAAWGISPGAVLSGMTSTSTLGNYSCVKCGKHLVWANGDNITVRGVSGLYQQWCWSCAGYKYAQGGAIARFETREDWIRESVPLESGTPAGIIADWLTDQSRYKEADYMREVADREMRMSGG